MENKILQEELLNWLNFIARYARENINKDKGYLYVWDGRDEQVCEQLKELIQKPPTCIFCALPIKDEEGACKSCANKAMKELSKQKKVSRKWIRDFVSGLYYDELDEKAKAGLNFFIDDCVSLLQELGYRVEGE